MSTFVDTSALLVILDQDAKQHVEASALWTTLVQSGEPLVVTNYVLLETFALVQNRLGLEAVRLFQQDVVPVLQVYWVDEFAHSTGVAALLVANRRHLSLVDCVSFDTMRRLTLNIAFTFDQHFAEQHFTCIP